MNDFTYMKDRDFSTGRRGIGASDWPTLSGVNPYKTPYEFWQERTGRKNSFKGNFRSAEGHFKEAGILGKKIAYDMLTAEVGTEYTASQWLKAISSEHVNDFITSRLWGDVRFEDFHSWTESIMPTEVPALKGRILAHADLLDLSKEIPILVQAKNTGQYAANARKRNPFKGYSQDDFSQDGIPLGVYLQEQGEMMCYGIPEAYVAVEIDGWNWKLYGPVKYRKKDAEKLLMLGERMLWHIDHDVPPAPESWPDIVSQFPSFEKNTKTTLSPSEELEARKIISDFNKASEKIRLLEKVKLDRSMALALLAGEPDTGVMHNYLCASDGSQLASFSERTGQERFDWKKFKEDHPDEAARFELDGYVNQDKSSRMIYVSGAPAGSVDLWTLITTDESGKKKKSRKKFDKSEKKLAESGLKQTGIEFEWEKFSR